MSPSARREHSAWRAFIPFAAGNLLLACIACTNSAIAPPAVAPPVVTACSAFAAGCATDQGPKRPVDLVAADLDGDGDPDLAIANEDSNTISVLLNIGDGRFTPSVSIPVVNGSMGPLGIRAGDLDGDGAIDLVVVLDLFRDDSVRWLRNRGDATFDTPQNLCCAGLSPSSVALTDLDGDGDTDLVTMGLGNPPQLAVRLNNGMGDFAAETLSPGVTAARGSSILVVADFNADDAPDIVALDTFDQSVFAFLPNSGDGAFPAVTLFDVPQSSFAITTGDLDGDGDVDVAIASGIGDESVTVYLNDGGGSFDRGGSFATNGPATSLAAADFDGDGDVDLAVASDTLLPTDDVCILFNRSDATFRTPATCVTVGAGPAALVAVDIDADGDVDIATVNRRSDNGSILLNDGRGGFTLRD